MEERPKRNQETGALEYQSMCRLYSILSTLPSTSKTSPHYGIHKPPCLCLPVRSYAGSISRGYSAEESQSRSGSILQIKAVSLPVSVPLSCQRSAPDMLWWRWASQSRPVVCHQMMRIGQETLAEPAQGIWAGYVETEGRHGG